MPFMILMTRILTSLRDMPTVRRPLPRALLTRLDVSLAMRLQVLADFHQNIAAPHLPSSVTSNEHHLISSSHA